MKHYIITNRLVKKDDTGKEYIYAEGDERSDLQLRFASFDTDTNEIEVFPDYENIMNYESLAPENNTKGSARMFTELYTSMSIESETKSDVLLYIHGFNNNLNDAIAQLKKLHEKYVVNESCIKHIVLFTWPSAGKIFNLDTAFSPLTILNPLQLFKRGKILEYKRDSVDAKTAGITLARGYLKLNKFFSQFFKLNEPCNNSLHLMSQSMGNQVLESMIGEIQKTGIVFGSLFKQIILTGADLDITALEPNMPLYNIYKICERVTLYYDTGDKVLTISETTKHDANRLGKFGPVNNWNIPKIVTVVDVSSVKDNKGIKNILFQHWNFISSETIMYDMKTVLDGKPNNDSSSFADRTFLPDRNEYSLAEKV